MEVEEGMMTTTPHGDPAQNGFHPSGSVGVYQKVGEVAGVMSTAAAVVRLAVGVEVSSGGSEVRRLAFANLMDVDTVCSGRETRDFHEDSNGFALGFKASRTDHSPSGVAKLDGRNGRDSNAAGSHEGQSGTRSGQGSKE